jgi:hypothetical protein
MNIKRFLLQLHSLIAMTFRNIQLLFYLKMECYNPDVRCNRYMPKSAAKYSSLP